LDCSIEILKNSGSIRKQIEEALNETNINNEKRKEIVNLYNESDVKEKVEQMVDSWLSFNNNHLPMFARPGTI